MCGGVFRKKVVHNHVIFKLLLYIICKEEVSVLSMEAQADLSLNANVSKVGHTFIFGGSKLY